MKSQLKRVLLSTAFLLSPIGPLAALVNAQSATVVPLPLPSIGTVPTATSSEQAAHDEETIRQLMYVVELSRQIGGGISQLYASSESMTSLLGFIRRTADTQLAAITGAKTFPLANGTGELSAREGGLSLRELATEGLAGSVTGPTDVATAFSQFSTTYKLGPAFDYQSKGSLAQVLVSHMASHGAVAASTAESSYKRTNESMGRIDGYITALSSSPDIKTSLDINTRVNIELTQQLNELVRSQAALTTLAGFYFMSAAGVQADADKILNFDDFNRNFR